MAGGQSDGQPDERSGERSGEESAGQAGALTGGLSGGEWWRVDGPWRVLGSPGSQRGARASDDGVYVDEPAPEVPVPSAPRHTLRSPQPSPPPTPPRGRPLLRKRRTPEPPAAPTPAPAAWLIAPAAPVPSGPVQPPTVADFPGWDSVVIEFPPDDSESADQADARLIPDQRRLAEEADPAGAEEADLGAGFAAPRGFLTGRRPSPLLLLAVGVLIGGAVSGLMLVMLAGWGLAYLSHRMGDLTRKFAVFGIPLLTMSGSSLWFWGRTQGRWGDPLSKGAPMTHALLASAPGVLRLAAVLSALFVLAVTMRRRRPLDL